MTERQYPRCESCWHRASNHTGATALKRAEFPNRRFTKTACKAAACTCVRLYDKTVATAEVAAKLTSTDKAIVKAEASGA